MIICVDCAGIEDAATLHSLLAEALTLPDWYGHNLDALYDCLTELEDAVQLVLVNWDDGAAFAEGFAGVFEDAQSDNPDFSVKYQ